MGAVLPLLLAPMLTSCARTVDYVTGRPTLNRYSLEQEIELGTRLATLMLASSEAAGQPIDADDPYTRTVWRIAGRILAVPENRARMPPLPWEVHVAGAEGANAWCFPGGQVVVLAGLLRSGLVRDEDEAAALIAHELAHGAARHATEERTLEELSQRIAPLGKFFGPRLVALATKDQPMEVQRFLLRERSDYDRGQEIEADLLGLELMTRAGYDPSRALEIWRRLDQAGLEHQTATHPTFEQRREQLELHLPATRWIAARLGRPVPAIGDERWTWTDPPAPIGSSTRALDRRRMLPGGPLVPGRFVVARGDVLGVRLRLFSGPSGEALRAGIIVEAARDLWEDRLPFDATLDIRAHGDGTRVYQRIIAAAAPLDRAEVPLRVALPRLEPGRYLIRVRVGVGAVRARAERLFEILERRL